jgi:hypothetical protein
LAIETAVITGTSPTSTGTKNFPGPVAFGTAQAAIVFVSEANTTNNPAVHGIIGVGFTDGTNEGAVSCGSEDGQGTSDTHRRSLATRTLLNVDIGASIRVAATFSAWASDGITLNFDIVGSVAYNLSIVLIKGCTSAYVGNKALTTTGVNDITDPTFKPNLVYIACVGSDVTTDQTHAIISFGAAHNNSSDVVTQGQVAYFSVGGQANDKSGAATRDDSCCGQLYNDAQNWKGSAQDFDANGFSINTGADAPNNDDIYYLALDTGDTDGVSIDIVDSPTSTGTWNVTAPGFEPQSVILGLTPTTTTNTIITADPINYGLSMFDDTNEACAAVDHDEDAATTDVQSNFSSSNGVETYEWGGSSHDLMHQGSFSAFDSSGYDLSFPTYIDGTARKWLSIAIDSGAAPAAGRIMGSLAGLGGLAGPGGLAGRGGGCAG